MEIKKREHNTKANYYIERIDVQVEHKSFGDARVRQETPRPSHYS